MSKTIDLTLARGAFVIAGMFMLGLILHYVGEQQNDGMPLLLLGIAGVVVGTILLCLALQSGPDGRSFTLPRIITGIMVSVGSVALASVFGYVFQDDSMNPTSLIAVGYLMPMMFWKGT